MKIIKMNFAKFLYNFYTVVSHVAFVSPTLLFMLLAPVYKEISISIVMMLSITIMAKGQYFRYVDADPKLEREAKDKEVYFDNLRKKVKDNWSACEKSAGCIPIGHTHDPNDLDGPCLPSPSPACACHCKCEQNYADALKRIEEEENMWRADYSTRYKSWKQKLANQETDQSNGSNQQEYEHISYNEQYQKAQNELENAKNISMQVYERTKEGSSESFAMAQGILNGASQISDTNTSLVYTGVGLGLSLFASVGEKKKEEHENKMQDYDKEIQKIQDERVEFQRKAYLIKTKEQFIEEVKNINKYSISDIVNNERYMSILFVPWGITTENQDIYFSMPLQVSILSDGTYPLRKEVEDRASMLVSVQNMQEMNLIVMYPIVNPEKFIDDFIKKMGSGTVINFDAHLLKLNESINSETPKQQLNWLPNDKKDSFWDN